jgi:23S rRNA (uracil1939-C5)-methyltransferase
VAEITPERAESVVYISCDPATLARDLKTLTGHGWKLARVAAVDMFPNTPHVETVCRLEA